jgi:hypothetical protein
MITKKLKNRILIIACVSPIIILIPRLFDCNWYDSFILGSTILCAVAAVAAVILGVLFYQDYGANKILDGKIDAVNKFLEEIKSMSVDVTCVDIKRPIDNQIIFWTRTNITKDSKLIDSLLKSGIDAATIPVVFEVNNYYDELENLNKISNSIYASRIARIF